MGRLREISRTAAFAWSEDVANPSMVSGTKAGALDADFSNDIKLELWDLELGRDNYLHQELQPVCSLVVDSK